MARSRKKMSEEEKKERIKAQKRKYIQNKRKKMTEAQLEERRKKDREKYQKKKAAGEIKPIKEQTPRMQRNIRKGWRERAQKYRDKIRELRRREREIINNETPPSSPAMSRAPSVSQSSEPSTSRQEMGKRIAEKNRRRLQQENLFLRKKVLEMENALAKYRMRLLRKDKTSNSISVGQGEEFVRRKKEKFLKMKEAVRKFLEQDDSSRLTAGKKETVTKNKIKKQKRLLNDSLLNLYKKFITDTGMKMSYAFFCRHRPFWILTPDARTRNTCLCTIHENMELMVKAMKGCKMITVNSANDVLKQMCCDGHLKSECIKRQCIVCKDKTIPIKINQDDDTIHYDQWVTKKVPVQIKNQTKLCQKTCKETFKTSKANLSRMFFKERLPKFMTHVYNIIHQYRITTKIKATLDENEAFLHIDFAENYNCKYSQEVQSAHFGGSKPQVSMHTAVLYLKNVDQSSTIECYCSISKNLRHDPVLICAHLKPVFEEIKRKVPGLHTMHFQSDGPVNQYRNKSMFYLIAKFISQELGVENILWHFSEAGHGKGAPDGIGGSLKRTADASVATGNDVSNFEAFVECLQEKSKGIRIFPIDDTHVNHISDILNTSSTVPFKGTLNIHQLTWTRKDPNIIHARRLSCATCTPDKICCHFAIGMILLQSKEKTSHGNMLIEHPRPKTPSPTISLPVEHSTENISPISSHKSHSPSLMQEFSESRPMTRTLRGKDFYKACYGNNSSDTETESETEPDPPSWMNTSDVQSMSNTVLEDQQKNSPARKINNYRKRILLSTCDAETESETEPDPSPSSCVRLICDEKLVSDDTAQDNNNYDLLAGGRIRSGSISSDETNIF